MTNNQKYQIYSDFSFFHLEVSKVFLYHLCFTDSSSQMPLLNAFSRASFMSNFFHRQAMSLMKGGFCASVGTI